MTRNLLSLFLFLSLSLSLSPFTHKPTHTVTPIEQGRISFRGREREFGAYELLHYDGFEWAITGQFEISSETQAQV